MDGAYIILHNWITVRFDQFTLRLIVREVRKSGTGNSDRRFHPRLYWNVASLSKTPCPHCFSRLSWLMGSRWEHPCMRCLFMVMRSLDKTAFRDFNEMSSHLYLWADIYICWADIYICWADIYICWADIYICWADIYMCVHSVVLLVLSY